MDAASILLAVLAGDHPVGVEAYPAGAVRWPSFSARDDGALWVARYRCSLDHLGITAGPQPLTEDTAAWDLVPPPHALARMPLGPAAAHAWSPQAAPDSGFIEATRRLPIARDAACAAVGARYRPEVLSLPDDDRGMPAFAVLSAPGQALVGTDDGKLYLIDATSARRFPSPGRRRYLAAYRSPDANLWLVSQAGEIRRGTVEAGFEVVSSTSSAPAPFHPSRQRMAMAGPTHEAPLELFVEVFGDDTISFGRFDGAAWTKLSEVRYTDRFFPGVVWLGPGEALAIGAATTGENAILRYQGGVLHEERLPGSFGVASILQHPTLGTLLGRDQEGIDRFDGMGWRQFAAIGSPNYIRTMWAEGPGFTYVGSGILETGASQLGQYQPSLGACPTLISPTTQPIYQALALDERTVLALTAEETGRPMGVTILHREPGTADCAD